MAIDGNYNHPFNRTLTTAEMEVNASYFAGLMLGRGWSINAIAGAFGNWESECKFNTNDPEMSGFPDNTSGGFGLPQWTPWYNRFGVWCLNNGIGITASDDNPAADIIAQLDYHDYECTQGWNGGATWYSNHGYSYTWEAFKKSLDAPSTLATAYYWQYERSAALDPATRPQQANKWYEFLQGVPPITPDNPHIPSKTNILDIILWSRKNNVVR